MNIIFVLLPLSLLLAGGGLVGYFWCVKNNQYSDPEGNSRRILFEE